MMSRRGSPGLQVVIGLGVVGLFLYGFYSYHEIQSRLRTTEEKADRLKEQHESASAQLKVVLEHKTRLEKAVQEEKTLHKKTREDLVLEKDAVEERLKQEKRALAKEVENLKAERDKLEDDLSKAESARQQVQEEIKATEEKCRKEEEQHQQQFNQQRQECDNDVAQLKDAIADLKRHNADLGSRLPNKTDDLAPGIVGRGSQNRSAERDNEEEKMQIAVPGENKQKAYFEVNSPEPVDRDLVEAKQQQQQQHHIKQVAPPVVRRKSVAGGGGADAEEEQDNRIKDTGRDVKDVTKKSFESNEIRRLPGEPANQGQVEAPIPTIRNDAVRGGADSQEEDIGEEHQNQEERLGHGKEPGQGDAPGQGGAPGQVMRPGHGHQLGQVKEPVQDNRPVAAPKVEDEGDENDDDQQPQEHGEQNLKKNPDKVDYDENQVDRAKDM